jgi:hypothetical protein
MAVHTKKIQYKFGDWLSTVEIWDDKVMSPEMRLKFWKFKEETQR